MPTRFHALTLFFAAGAMLACESATDPGLAAGAQCTSSSACASKDCLGSLCPVAAPGKNYCVASSPCPASGCPAGQICMKRSGEKQTACVPETVCGVELEGGKACGSNLECASLSCVSTTCTDTGKAIQVCASGDCDASGQCDPGEKKLTATDTCYCIPESACQ